MVDEEWRQFYHGLRKFVPRYYGAQLYDMERARFNVRLENLLNIYNSYDYDKVLQNSYSKEEFAKL
jgi:hypothetical protein